MIRKRNVISGIPGNRCCSAHVKDGPLKSVVIEKLPITDQTFVNRTAILSLLRHLRVLCQINGKKKQLDFDDRQTLTDSACLSLLGLSMDNLQTLYDF